MSKIKKVNSTIENCIHSYQATSFSLIEDLTKSLNDKIDELLEHEKIESLNDGFISIEKQLVIHGVIEYVTQELRNSMYCNCKGYWERVECENQISKKSKKPKSQKKSTKKN